MKTLILCVFATVMVSNGRVIIEPSHSLIWAREGKNLNVTCKYTGSKPTDITWTINGSDVRRGKDFFLSKTSIRTFNSSLVSLSVFKRGAQISDSGNYACVAGQNVKSVKVAVTKGKLRVSPDIGIAVVVTRKPLSLICQFEGIEKLTVVWNKTGSGDVRYLGFSENKWSIVKDGAIVTVKISKRYAGPEDSGEYACTAGPYSKTVKVQVYDDICSEYLVRKVKDDKITASSFYEDTLYSDAPPRGRLNTTKQSVVGPTTRSVVKYLGGAWQPTTQNTKQWIQVEFSGLTVVTAILTQGRSSTECCNQQQWVTSYRVQVSRDSRNWFYVKTIERGEKSIFAGNTDHDTIVTQQLPFPVVARQLRIKPETWSEKIALRFEAIGCILPSTLKMIYPITPVHNIRPQTKMRITCQFHGPNMQSIEWYKDGAALKLGKHVTRTTSATSMDDGTTVIESITKEMADFTDTGNYTCQESSLNIRARTELNVAELSMRPCLTRLWVSAGQIVNVSCEYRGLYEKQIEWSHDRSDVNRFSTNQKSRNIAGVNIVTSKLWKIAEVTDSGNVTCKVGGIAKSLPLRVVGAKRNKTSRIFANGGSLTLSCDVDGIANDVKYRVFWSREDVPLDEIPDMKGRYEHRQHSKYLFITSSRRTDAGRYQCNIILDVDTPNQQTVTFSVVVYAAPNVSIEGMKSARIGGSLHLYCKASGYPKPVVSWTKNGRALPNDSSRFMYMPYEGSPIGHLIVFNVKQDEAGSYECRGKENGIPVVTSQRDIAVEEEPTPPPIILITVCVILFIIVGACTVGCIFKIKNSREKRKLEETTSTLERGSQERPPLPKPYVKLPTGPPCTADDAHLLSRTADAISISSNTTWDDYSETYEKYERPSRPLVVNMPTTQEEIALDEPQEVSYLNTTEADTLERQLTITPFISTEI